MQTPYGQECPYYYLNAHRTTRVREGCHLIVGSPDAARWTSGLCAQCPVPAISQANRCENMTLRGRIARRPGRFWERPRVLVTATCSRAGVVPDPMVGCGQCHAPIAFVVGDEADSDR